MSCVRESTRRDFSGRFYIFIYGVADPSCHMLFPQYGRCNDELHTGFINKKAKHDLKKNAKCLLCTVMSACTATGRSSR